MVLFFFTLCYSLPTNVETLLRAGQVPPFWTNLFVFLIDVLFSSLECPVHFHPVPSADGGWMGLILPISDNVVATLYLQAQRHDLPALLLSEMTGLRRAGGQDEGESIRVSDSCKTICCRQEIAYK